VCSEQKYLDAFNRAEGGLIKYSRHSWDMTELLGQIGALPSAG
jgi:hypothetical protein